MIEKKNTGYLFFVLYTLYITVVKTINPQCQNSDVSFENINYSLFFFVPIIRHVLDVPYYAVYQH